MAYLLDSNVFIQAKNLHYGLDFCPAFWEWLLEKNQSASLFSIDKVGDEINAGDDELTEWMKHHATDLLLQTDANVVGQLAELSRQVMAMDYEPMAKSTFFQVADYYLIGHAMSGGHVVVTHEVPANSTKKIKIPNICVQLGLQFITPYEMLRREKARFVLPQR